MATHLQLPRGSLPPQARKLASDILRQDPDNETQSDDVESLRRHLYQNYRYLPPGGEGSATSLSVFLAGEAGGHCEFFASALAVLLRLESIPCRVVTGYRSREWNDDGSVLTIRARHAHAWVEVLDPGRGWYTVDATPAAELAAGPGEPGLLGRLRNGLQELWNKVTGFDEKARGRVLQWFAAVPGRLGRLGQENPVLVGLCLGGAVLWIGWFSRRRRRLRRPSAVWRYEKVVGALGLERRPGETPRELLRRAGTLVLEPLQQARLAGVTRLHEEERYRVGESLRSRRGSRRCSPRFGPRSSRQHPRR